MKTRIAIAVSTDIHAPGSCAPPDWLMALVSPGEGLVLPPVQVFPTQSTDQSGYHELTVRFPQSSACFRFTRSFSALAGSGKSLCQIVVAFLSIYPCGLPEKVQDTPPFGDLLRGSDDACGKWPQVDSWM